MGNVSIGEQLWRMSCQEADNRLIGFEEFGNSDVFTAKALEFRLQISGMSSPPDQRCLLIYQESYQVVICHYPTPFLPP
jgi:hypothetical protein